MIKSYRFVISGRVQGVWYRANIQKNAIYCIFPFFYTKNHCFLTKNDLNYY